MGKQASNIRDLWESYRVLFVGVFLAVVMYMAFGGVGENEFILFDDGIYITQNPIVLQGLGWESIQWAFTTFLAGNWHPLTWLSHMADVEFFGIRPAGHHFMNLAFHISSVMIIFGILYQTTRRFWPAVFASVLFGIHPLRVESVAWAAERKDVLSCFFGLLAIWAYIQYTLKKTGWRYSVVVILLLLGLMSKSMLVTWPFVFLLLDFWPLRRYPFQSQESLNGGEFLPSDTRTTSTKKLCLEKIPFFLLSMVFCIIAFFAQRNTGAVINLEKCPFALRLENVGTSYVLYLYKMIWPAKLALLYPFSKDASPLFFVFCLIILCSLTAVAVIWRKKSPWLTFGWLWYLGTLVPVIGLVQLGNQSMADRYTYIPSIGISIITAWLVGEVSRRSVWLRQVLIGGCILVGGVLLLVTWRQVMYWKYSTLLYEHTIEVTGDNHVMRVNYAVALKQAGEFDHAFEQCQKILDRWPDIDTAKVLQEEILMQTGQDDKAIERWLKYLQTKPASPEMTLCNLGVAYARKKDYTAAQAYLQQAIDANPKYTDAYINLGVVLKKQGQIARAIESWEKVLNYDKNEPAALRNLGWTLAVSSDPAIANPQKALRYAQRAAEIARGRSVRVLDALAAAYASCGQYEKAIDSARQALEKAREEKQETLVSEIQERITRYQQHKPYQE